MKPLSCIGTAQVVILFGYMDICNLLYLYCHITYFYEHTYVTHATFLCAWKLLREDEIAGALKHVRAVCLCNDLSI